MCGAIPRLGAAAYTTRVQAWQGRQMAGLAQFLLLSGVIVCGTIVSIVFMGIQYSSRKRGLTEGAPVRELAELHTRLDAVGADVHEMKEAITDLTLMLGDASRPALTRVDT